MRASPVGIEVSVHVEEEVELVGLLLNLEDLLYESLFVFGSEIIDFLLLGIGDARNQRCAGQ